MGVFVLTPETREDAGRVRRFAEARENWYVPGSTAAPGSDPRYIFYSGNCRIVFSWTLVPTEGRPFRHLSVSVSTPGRAPHPVIVFTVAHLMGFTGVDPGDGGIVTTFGDRWLLGQDVEENAAVVQEPVLDS